MRTLSDLQKEIDTLPLGNVYPKVIKGRMYYYHQYFLDGKRVSKLIPENEVEALWKAIARRRELQEELKRRCKAKRAFLSEYAKRRTGYLMSGDDVVAVFEEGSLVDFNEKRCPLSILRTHNLDSFLRTRVIDSSRVNARLLKKALGIQGDDPEVSLYAYGASISDTYWFKPKHSKMTYADARFDGDAFFDLSLRGDTFLYPARAKRTPELTTNGSFEKGWKLIDGKWWLYKTATKSAAFSELFCALLAPTLGVPSAVYEWDGEFVRSPNFAEDVNFEPMYAIAGEDDRYERVYDALEPYGQEIRDAYLMLIFFDALTNNVDRHNENCGLLRDRKSGEVLSLAPNFDCNLALVSRGELNDNPGKDGFIKLYLQFVRSHPEAMRRYAGLLPDDYDARTIEEIYLSLPEELRAEQGKEIVDALWKRYCFLFKETRC